jgi:hypothetical protein
MAVIGLVASHPREKLLLTRSLPSIRAQTRPVDALVIATDRTALCEDTKRGIRLLLQPILVVFVQNLGTHGVAGTLNAGLDVIARHWPQCYVAILDDDDRWDPEHIDCCYKKAEASGWPDIVLSGLRVWKDGIEIPRLLPKGLRPCDFLAGNPGWQGSNTFVKFCSLRKCGSFTPGLISSGDRDFAIRLLSQPGTRIAYTGKFTSNWICAESPEALSAPASEQKLTGLAQFYALYGGHMARPRIREAFFHRAKLFFQFEEHEILEKMQQLAEAGRIPGSREWSSPPIAEYVEIIERFREFKARALLSLWMRTRGLRERIGKRQD